MIVHQVFAQIFQEEVKHVMVCNNYDRANFMARAAYGPEAFAVDALQYQCTEGDRYHDGRFFRAEEDGTETEIPYIPTQEQQVQTLNHDTEIQTEYQMDLDYRLSCQELGV